MRLTVLPACLAAVLVLAACGEKDEPPAPDPLVLAVGAAERTVEAGPSRITVGIEAPAGVYHLEGIIDPGDAGYRACLRVTSSSFEPEFRGVLLWLDYEAGTYQHLLKGLVPLPGNDGAAGCRYGGWFDDHPPSLPLFRSPARRLIFPPGGDIGAEHLTHIAFLALTQTRDLATGAEWADNGEQSELVASVDFTRFDRKPPQRDENAWQVRPLFRRAGVVPIGLSLDGDGHVRAVRFEVPNPIREGPASGGTVSITITLGAIGEAPQVPTERQLTCRGEGRRQVCSSAIE